MFFFPGGGGGGEDLGFRVWGLGFRVWGLGFRAWGFGVSDFWCSGVWGFRGFGGLCALGGWGLGSRGCRVWGLGV